MVGTQLAVRAALFVALAVGIGVGCSSSSDSGGETFSFKDARGRSCTVKRFPPKATCDVPSTKTCIAGSSPCYIVSTGKLAVDDAGVSGPMYVRNCDSCCKDGENTSSSTTSDCVPLTCTTEADCAGESATCIVGQCQSAR